ncbi:NPCBM/NEW2 domain-containing protein [Streptomyces sp. KK5PA1]|uniref:Alpha-galactosidase n=1 Tax=Actinacidiphila acididurans TaxID=2784346 RepID=A0ABS2TZD3_9ACTN|nr:NPCBM/NEW2 domain-containing protein [Actinacidiphila acididurans]MBM9508177.1 NPCBM/NEW2 domain-containing protein [Actinacidiphila acididurans]
MLLKPHRPRNRSHTLAQRLAAGGAALATVAAGLAGAAVLTAGATLAQFAAAPAAAAVDNGLALAPQMGFNDWNAFGCNVSEQLIEQTADAFVSSGLKAAGYTYVNIDDCWMTHSRDASGRLVPDPAKFPDGIKGTADYVHARGLKLGIYEDAGTATCAGYPGSLGHETTDAQTFADWGVDYLKYDNCNNNSDGSRQDFVNRYTAMGNALKATGRPILYSLCEWGQQSPWEWAGGVGNSWRTTGDIGDSWSSMIGIAHQNQPLAAYAGPGAWNDPDMLEVGNGGMTDTEYRTHFSLWSEMAAPLLIGTDVRTASAATLAILGNTDVIAVDQDALGKQGTVVSNSGGLVVMSKPLADGGRAVTLTNENTGAQTVSTTVSALGIGGASSYAVKDLWSKATSTTTGSISASVPAHGTVMLRVTPGTPVPPPTGVNALSDLPWTSAVSGWGPVERDHSNGEQAAGDGHTLTIGGVTYAKGLGVHAASDISFHTGGLCTRFSADVGVDDEVGANGSVDFQVYRDGTLVADSGTRTGNDPPARLTAGLTGGGTLRLVVTDAGDGINYDHADWAGATVACGSGPTAGTHALSDVAWESAVSGWGPVEHDRSNGEQAAGNGHTLTIGGVTYAKGLGVHAVSRITYYLAGNCRTLTTDVGVDDESTAGGSVDFQVYRDSTLAADSGVVTNNDSARHLTADLTGAMELTLVVTDGGDGNTYDHADWAGPVLAC